MKIKSGYILRSLRLDSYLYTIAEDPRRWNTALTVDKLFPTRYAAREVRDQGDKICYAILIT